MKIIQVYKGMFSAESDTYILENGSYYDYSEVIEFTRYPHREMYKVKSVNWDNLDSDGRAMVRDEIDDPEKWKKIFEKVWYVN